MSLAIAPSFVLLAFATQDRSSTEPSSANCAPDGTSAVPVQVIDPSPASTPSGDDAQLALAATAPVDAPVPRVTTNATISVVNDYVFRGITQTHENPALQAGFGWGHCDGWYLGFWGSNVSWFSDISPASSTSLETDFYAGYKGGVCSDVTIDAGVIRYQYFGEYHGLGGGLVRPNSTEAYAALGWKWLTAKYSYSIGDLFGVDDSAGSGYYELNASFELPQQFLLGLHTGHQHYAGDVGATSNESLYDYSDWSASISRPIGDGFVLGLTYTGTDAKDAGYTALGDNIGDEHWIVSLVKTF
jgi:uncharacterized protein (TIGR02001 family)